jgi:hypothetical protein
MRLLLSRRETRNRQSAFVQIKNSSKRAPPLPADGFRPRTPGLFPVIKFTPIKAFSRVNWGISEGRKSSGSPTREDPRTDSLLWTAELVGCNAENYVPSATYRLARLTRFGARHRLAVSALPLNPRKANPAQRDETASHFPRIGVPSAQQHGDIVSSHLRLKYKTHSRQEEQMP